MFVGSPSTSRTGCPARSASVASSVASTPASPSASASRKHVAPKRLRRLREIDRLARQRLGDDHRSASTGCAAERPASTASRFTVSRAGSAASAAPIRGRRNRPRDRDRRSQTAAPRRGSRSTSLRVADGLKRVQHRILTPRAAGHDAQRLRRGPQVRRADRPTSSAGSATTTSSIAGMRRETRRRCARESDGRRRPAAAWARAPPNRRPRPPAAMIAVTTCMESGCRTRIIAGLAGRRSPSVARRSPRRSRGRGRRAPWRRGRSAPRAPARESGS